MDGITTLDSTIETPKYEFSRKTTYLIVALVVMLLIASLVLTQMMPLEESHLLKYDGSTTTANEMRKMLSLNLLGIVPIASFVIGAILSLIPFKGIPFKGKWLRFSLIIMLVIFVFQVVRSLMML